MAGWGIFNKIKHGFKKIGDVFNKGLSFVNDNVVKPLSPVIRTVANTFIPGSGALVDTVTDGIDAATQGNWQGVLNAARNGGNKLQEFLHGSRNIKLK